MFELKKGECGKYLRNDIDTSNSCIIQKFNDVYRMQIVDNGLHFTRYFELTKYRAIPYKAKKMFDYEELYHLFNKFNFNKNLLMSL